MVTRVNTASINGGSATATATATIPGGTGIKAGDLIYVSAGSQTGHVTNGISVSDAVNGVNYTTILETDLGGASSRWLQSFYFVTPVDIPDGTVLTCNGYSGAANTEFSVDIFRGLTGVISRAAVGSSNASGTSSAAPALATAPVTGDLVLTCEEAGSGTLTPGSPFTVGSSGTTGASIANAFVLGADGVSTFGSTWTLGTANTSAAQTVAFQAIQTYPVPHGGKYWRLNRKWRRRLPYIPPPLPQIYTAAIAAGPSATIQTPTGVGDAILAWTDGAGTPTTCTDSQGNTYVQVSTANSGNALFVSTYKGSPGTPTVPLGTSDTVTTNGSGGCTLVQGVRGRAAVAADAAPAFASGTSAAPSGPATGTMTQSSDIVITGYLGAGALATSAWGAGFVQSQNVNNLGGGSISVGWQVSPGTASITPSATLVSSTGWTGYTVALSPATGAPTSTNAPAAVATSAGVALQPTTAVTVNAGVATAAGVANPPTPAVAATAGVATGAGVSNPPSVTSTANAAVATSQGVAAPPTPAVAVFAGVAAAAGVANQPTVSTVPATNAPAGVATSTGVANPPAVDVKVNAAVAASAGVANAPAHASTVAPPAATSLGVANPPLPAATVNAGVATSQGVSLPPVPAGAANAAVAPGAGVSNPPAPAITVNAGVATAAGVANQPVVSTTGSTNVFPGAATAAGVANPPSTAITVPAAVAAGAGVSNPPVPAVGANAGVAAAAGVANPPATAHGANAAVAAAAGVSNPPVTAHTASAGVAAGAGVSNPPTPAIQVNAGVAAAAGVANPATVSTATQTNAPAAVAAAAGVASPPSIALSVKAGVAMATGTASSPVVSATITVVAASAAGGVAPKPDLANSAEGGTAGAAVTGGNSGGLSGDPWDTVQTAANGGSTTYDGTTVAHGSRSYKIVTGSPVASGGLLWTTSLTTTAVPQAWFRVYINLPVLPPAGNLQFADFRSGSTARSSFQLSPAGHFSIRNSLNQTLATGTATVSAGQWFRVEGTSIGDPSAGMVELKVFVSDPESVTPDEVLTGTATNTGGLINRVSFGNPSSIASYTMFVDDPRASLTGYIGPFLTPPSVGALPSAAAAQGAALQPSLTLASLIHPSVAAAAGVSVQPHALPQAATVPGSGTDSLDELAGSVLTVVPSSSVGTSSVATTGSASDSVTGVYGGTDSVATKGSGTDSTGHG